MKQTINLSLNKPEANDVVNIDDLNANFDTIDTEIKNAKDKADKAFQSASNGKGLIKNAITGVDPSVPIPNDATFQQLADAINRIETGINTDDATAVAGDMLSGKIAYSKGKKVIGTITSKSAATITPTTADQKLSAGQYLSGDQTFKGDPNLVSANILKDKSIFGVNGSAEALIPITGSTTAKAKYLTALSKGNLVTTRRHYGYDTPIALPSPAVLPTGSGYSVAYSSDGIYLAVGHLTSPFITIYKRNGDTFTKLANPDALPTGICYSLAFSPDGTHLAVGSIASPYLIIYKRSGDTFTKLSTTPGTGANSVNSVAFSPNGTYLAIGLESTSTGSLTIYKRNGDFYDYIDGPSMGYVKSVAFSSDSTYLAIGCSSNPMIKILKRNGDTFTKLADPASTPVNIPMSIAFSPDNTYLAVGVGSSLPHIWIYKRNGDIFTKLADPAITPTNSVYSVAFSPEGTYLAVGFSSSPYLHVYKRSGDTFTKLANPATLPNSTVWDIDYNKVNSYFTVGYINSPFITTYKGDILGDYAYKYNGIPDLYVPNYINFGYVKADGVANYDGDVVTIPVK